MKLRSVLPINRWLPGLLTVEDDFGAVVLGPFPCRGKADGQIAAAKGNPSRFPTMPYGDHPSGAYRVLYTETGKLPASSFGPFFLLLDPLSGRAAVAKQNGRAGLAIHGGDLNPDGSLRSTKGCLRISNEAVSQIAALGPTGWFYECEEPRP